MRILLMIIGLVLSSFLLHAQKNYAVKVADSKTEDPIAKAVVVIKSTKEKAVTNETGLLVINASPGDVLSVSCAGYVSQEAYLTDVISSVHVFLKKKEAPRRRKL